MPEPIKKGDTVCLLEGRGQPMAVVSVHDDTATCLCQSGTFQLPMATIKKLSDEWSVLSLVGSRTPTADYIDRIRLIWSKAQNEPELMAVIRGMEPRDQEYIKNMAEG